jgi:hypothetical protein
MIDINNDEYWVKQFDITQDDMKRLEGWLQEQNRDRHK